MTTHLDTSPTIFALPALRGVETERMPAVRAVRPAQGRRERSVVPAFLGVLLGNIVLWSTVFIGLGILLVVQLGIVGLVGAALLR